MDHALIKASHHLSELDIRVPMFGYLIRVCWFRIMFKEGDWFIRRHAHTTYELHFIARGECEVIHDEGSFRVGAGSFFLTGPEVHHSQRPSGTGELVEYSLNCEIEAAPQGTPESGNAEMAWLFSILRRAPCAAVPDGHGAVALFETALREADRRLPGFTLTVRNLVPMIIVAAARSLAASCPDTPVVEVPEPVSEDRMAQIERYVADNLGMDLAPVDVAGHMNVSERQLDRIVMHHKGYSTKKFITRLKLKRAKALLEETDMILKAVLHLCAGLTDHSHSCAVVRGCFTQSCSENCSVLPWSSGIVCSAGRAARLPAVDSQRYCSERSAVRQFSAILVVGDEAAIQPAPLVCVRRRRRMRRSPP
ncbi:MAG: AraC family transcriptional regulator [Spirochaetes bacterium]|nr:AraC family transcriptional regulator [Spirochaetota bacterium]